MDPDWESQMRGSHGLFRNYAVGDLYKILEENDEYRIIRQSDGSVEKNWFNQPPYIILLGMHWNLRGNHGSSLRHYLIRMMHGGSLYGWIRNWMGVEQISYFMYDEPELLEEMVSYIADFLIEVSGNALLKIEMDAAYIWEDCCGATGPLFSPTAYKEIFDKHYKRLFKFYKSMGVKNILLDSDGYCDPLIPSWLESGVDIIFPLEVGTWENTPDKVRNKFGRNLKIFGGINKFKIGEGKDAIREHLLELKPCVDEGGIIPIPDHRIPPGITIKNMYGYIEVFNEVFNG